MPTPNAFVAGSQARAFAYIFDLCAVALLLIPTAYGTYLLGMPSSTAFELSVILFVYHTYFLAYRSGRSPGKFIQSISVVGADGSPLRLVQSLARACTVALPWALIGLADEAAFRPQDLESPVRPLATVGVLWLLGEVLLIEFTSSRQSASDRIARTLVVKLPPPQPHRAPAAPMLSANDVEFGHPPKRPASPSERAAWPNHSLKLTRYGIRCLPASGHGCYCPYAGKQRIPPRAA